MRRWLALLLLVLLPLQASWAAMAGYCAHERGAQVHDIGLDGADDHGPVPSDRADVPQPCAGASDGHHCHGHCVALVELGAPPPPVPPCGAPAPAVTTGAADQPAARPERPQWSGLA